jgi:hypothetical protein
VKALLQHQNAALLAALVVAHTATLLFVPRDPAFQVEIFKSYADKISSGLVPYADFAYEYPPLSLIVLLPRLLSADPATYAFLFGLEMLLFDIIILFTLSRIGAKALFLYGVGLVLFWRLPYIRHDLAMIAVSTLAALLMLRGRGALSAVFWGLGGALKLYPMVAVPALAFGENVRGIVRRWTVAGVVFVVGILWGIVAFGWKALEFLTYHSDRPAMIESLPANALLLLPGHRVVHSYGSFNVVGPAGEVLVEVFTFLQPAMVLLALVAVWMWGQNADRNELAVKGTAMAILAFAIFGKVLSPHFLMWPLPLLAMSTGLGMVRLPRLTWALFFGIIALTAFINSEYYAITENLPYFTALLSARNLLLLPLFTLFLLPPQKK